MKKYDIFFQQYVSHAFNTQAICTTTYDIEENNK